MRKPDLPHCLFGSVSWGIFAVDPGLCRDGTVLPGCDRKVGVHAGASKVAGSLGVSTFPPPLP